MNKPFKKISKTFSRLMAHPAIEGIGNVLCLYPEKYQLRKPTEKTDAEAMKEDWEAVGNDLWSAIHKFKKHQTA